jgi:hypothetical protein
MLMETERLDDTLNALMPAPAVDACELRHFVMLTEPNGEFKARDSLAVRGFEPWIPIEEYVGYRTIRRFYGVTRVKYDAARPVFRGYLFLPLNLAWSFGALYDCPGLRQNGNPFLTINERPATLSPIAVERIRRIEYALTRTGKPTSPYKIGDKVIVDGFEDTAAKIIKLDDKGRIEVLMDILGGQTVKTTTLKIAPAS